MSSMSIQACKFQDTNTINSTDHHLQDSFHHHHEGGREEDEEDDDKEEDELIGVVSRANNCPWSLSAACSDHKPNSKLDGKVRKTFSMRSVDDDEEEEEEEKQSSSSSAAAAVERAVRRAFSMRGNSMKEVYRRIDQQYDPVPVGDDEENNKLLISNMQYYNSDKNMIRNKVLQTCRRFFGL